MSEMTAPVAPQPESHRTRADWILHCLLGYQGEPKHADRVILSGEFEAAERRGRESVEAEGLWFDPVTQITWRSPTAWAYAAVCEALHKREDEAMAAQTRFAALEAVLRDIARRCNESGTGEMAERETIYTVHRMANEALAASFDKRSGEAKP